MNEYKFSDCPDAASSHRHPRAGTRTSIDYNTHRGPSVVSNRGKSRQFLWLYDQFASLWDYKNGGVIQVSGYRRSLVYSFDVVVFQGYFILRVNGIAPNEDSRMYTRYN